MATFSDSVLALAQTIAADIKSLTTLKADKLSVVDLLSAQTVAGLKTFSTPPAVSPLPTLSTSDTGKLVHKKYVDDLVASVTASSGATSTPINYVPAVDRDVLNLGYSRRKEYFIPANELKNYVNSDTDAVKLAAIQWNTNVGLQAVKNNPNKLIVFDPAEAWPIQLSISGWDTANFATAAAQVPVRIKGRFKQPVGSFVSQAEADAWKNTGANPNGRVPSASVIDVTRTWGDPQDVASVGRVIFGPNLPPWYQPSQDATQIVLAAGAYSGWTVGDSSVICSGDYYDFSMRAVNANSVWKAQYLEINAIGVDVANYTVAAVSSANVAAGRSPLIPNGQNNGMESRLVKGATSLTQALVRGDTGNAQLLFTSLPSTFQLNEQLIDVQTNLVIGTVAKQYLVIPGKLDDAYTTTPCIRKVRRDIPVVLDVEVEAAVDPSTRIDGWNRPTEINLTGTYDHSLKVDIKSGLGRGLAMTSCKRGRIDGKISGLPNHALENELSEAAYGYGAGTLGCSEDLWFFLDVENVRHGFSTNVLGGTYNLRSNGGTGTHIQSTNYQKYGTTRNVTVEGSFRYTFGAGLDTHEGCRNLIFQNFKVIKPFWGGRILSGGTGVNTRGHNTVIQNGYIEDVRDGVSDASQYIPSGSFGSVTIIKNVTVNGFQNYGYGQADVGVNYSSAYTIIEDCVFIGDPTVLTSEMYQAGMYFTYGRAMTKGVIIRSVNGSHILHKGTATTATPPRQGGSGIHINPVFDFTVGSAATAVRYEAHMETAAVVDPVIIAAGVNRPQYIFRHEVGAPTAPNLPTDVQYQGIKIIQTVTPKATPILNYNGALVNSVPTAAGTATRIADFGEAAAAASLPAGGTTGQVLRKNSATDGDASWATIREVPVGGSTGQILRKSSGVDGEAAWAWAASATKVNVDGVFQGTLDISSAPNQYTVTTTTDIAGPTQTANGATPVTTDVPALQVTLPVGTYEIDALIVQNLSAAGTGALRLGLGGAGAPGGSATYVIESHPAQSGSVVRTFLNTIGAAGSNASSNGTNVFGNSVTTANQNLGVVIQGRLIVTTPGVFGLMAALTYNATATTATIKAGSSITFTKVA